MGTFESFYASELQHPWLLWAAAVAAFAFCRTRAGLQPSVRRYCTLLVALSLADAWLTADPVYGVGALPGRAASLVPLFFVLAGDYRFLLLFGTATPDGAIHPTPRALVSAALLTAVVPLLSQALLLALPEPAASSPRVLFLVYELLFCGLTLVLLRVHPRVREVRWLVPIGRFVLLYYGLWALADAILLTSGAGWAFGLRVVPNVLYYGGLIAVIAWASGHRESSAQ